MTRPARLVLNRDALRHNLRRAREAAPGARVMAVVKADAYGHGAVEVARALEGADAYAVASADEALRLREAGIDRPIVLLGGLFSDDELPLIVAHRLTPVIHQAGQLAALEAARLARPIPVWLKLDSGMHRLGFAPGEVRGAWERLQACPNVLGPPGLMTHLARADDRSDPYTQGQIETFERALHGLPGARSIANSAGVLGWPGSHADWVRPGIMLYGASPLLGRRAVDLGLRPAMTLETRLIAVRELPRGATVGYGGDWACPERMPVGAAAIGYGDGYPRHAPAGTPVLVNGRLAPLIGRVSMDLITLDLRAHPGARPGDAVVLWGEAPAAEVVAERAGTIAYELFCAVAPRVGRALR